MSYKVYVHKKDSSWRIFDDGELKWLDEFKQAAGSGRQGILSPDNWIVYITNNWEVALSFIGKDQTYKSFGALLPALKDGQSVKRRDWGVKMRLEGGKFKFYDPSSSRCRGEMCLYDKDILANDWEICEVKGIPTGNLTGMCGKCGGGMTFEEMLPLLRKGAAVFRPAWNCGGNMICIRKDDLILVDKNGVFMRRAEFSAADLMADDWSIGKEIDFYPLNMELNAFKVVQVLTNVDSDQVYPETICDCKRSMGLQFEDLVGFFADWEKLVKYAQTLNGKIKAKCEFKFGSAKTYQVFHMLLEGSNLKNFCRIEDYRVDNCGYYHQEPLIQFSGTILLSGGK